MKKLLLLSAALFMLGLPPMQAQTAAAKAKQETAGKIKRDGTPDKRFKENKKVKKDGTPDRHFKENKKK